jgi:hypothetical protein
MDTESDVDSTESDGDNQKAMVMIQKAEWEQPVNRK